jgi:hypothetical protein
MKIAICLAASFLVLQQPNGCDQGAKPVGQDKPPLMPYQRFIPTQAPVLGGGVNPMFVALDTKTGQLCETVGFVTNPTWMVGTPTCKSLYDKYPDSN